MRFFLLSLLITLSLGLAPGKASAATSPECSMPDPESGTAADHEEMGCCTPDCAAPGVAAVVPRQVAELHLMLSESQARPRVRYGAPPLFDPADIDPPPRHPLA